MSPLDPDLPAIVSEDYSLSQLARQINSAHLAGDDAVHKGFEHYRQVGLMLIAAKEKCAHGEWLPWVAEHLRFSDRQARKYMQLAREWDRFKSEPGSDLSSALRILAENAEEVDRYQRNTAPRSGREPHPFADLLTDVTGLARRFTQTMAGHSEESKKLRDYLSYAGLVDHKGAWIEGDEIHDALATFLPLKGVRAVIELVPYPGRKSPEEVRAIYDKASGGFVPPITMRRRKKSKRS